MADERDERLLQDNKQQAAIIREQQELIERLESELADTYQQMPPELRNAIQDRRWLEEHGYPMG